MPENTSDSSSLAKNTATKRYAPPNQRNRSLSRRKSGGITSIRVNDGEKNQVLGLGDAVGSNVANEDSHAGLISLHGCCKSDAFRFLNDRWAAAISAFNNPSIDLAERPVMYSGSGASAWGHFRHPHQVDFLSQLHRAIHDASPMSDA